MKDQAIDIQCIVASNREDRLQEFVKAWTPELEDRLMVVEDGRRSFKLPSWVVHYGWEDIDRDLAEGSWIIPRRSTAVRSYGLLRAYRAGVGAMWALDDDCLPEPGRRGTYLTRLELILQHDYRQTLWVNPVSADIPMRGYPKDVDERREPVVIHHGFASGIPDIDGETQRDNPEFRLSRAVGTTRIPRGSYFPMSIMNLAWRREITPALYLGLQGESWPSPPSITGLPPRTGPWVCRWPYNRYDDIWAGLFAKRICDHLGFAVTCGSPSVYHSRASDVERNIVLEAPGKIVNEWLYESVSSVALKHLDVLGCYRDIAEQLPGLAGAEEGGYWMHLSMAMRGWLDALGSVAP